MRLMWNSSWQPRPLSSFFGFMDIKSGTTVVILFAVSRVGSQLDLCLRACVAVVAFQLFNKVAGVYGLLAIFTGGSLAQVSMYLYSVLTFVLFAWGLRAVSAVSLKLHLRLYTFADNLCS
jgi:inositol phosphorylceramide synthase regulatory subunit